MIRPARIMPLPQDSGHRGKLLFFPAGEDRSFPHPPSLETVIG
jgi:hypothetical protein